MAESSEDKVGRLLEEALERPPDERVAFLEEACEKESVRKELLSLLEAIEEAPGFFENLAAAVPDELLEGEKAEGPGLRADDPLDLEGTRVGRYVVEEHLGRGGMGVVYKARDPRLGRPVALKFLPPHLMADREAEERFTREARAASALEHPHIATIYEIGETEESRRFIAMAYYEGESLKEKIGREGPLPIEEALGYAEQIAEALSRAHEAGIIHRDVKPANVMVTSEGEVKLLDFGLAKAVAETRLTDPGQQMGTAAYMSPEQAEGKEVDGRTDLWALGVLLYEMLVGTRPFEGGRETAVLRSILDDAPVPLGERRGEVSSELEQVVHRCLQKDPGERYASADDLLEDLRALRSGVASVPQETGAVRSGWAALGSRRWIVGAAAAALLLALAVALGWVLWPGGGAATGSASAGLPRPPSIAVLPFEDQGTEPEALGTGLAGAIIAELSASEKLVVVARSSVIQYRGADLTPSQIAGRLGATYVLDGTVQQAEGRIRVAAELIEAGTGRVRWAQAFDRPMAGIFEVQSEVALQVAKAVGAELAPEARKQVAERPTTNEAAYRLYLRAQELQSHIGDPELGETESAIELLRQTVRLDSTFALGHAALAEAFEDRGDLGSDKRWLDSARAAAERALKIDPGLAEAHYWRGIVYMSHGKMDSARVALKRALEFKPGHTPAMYYLGFLGQVHDARWADALRWFWKVLPRWPKRPQPRGGMGYVMLGFGEDAASMAWRHRTVELGSRFYIWQLLLVDLAREDLDAARRHLERYRAWDANHPRVLQWSGLLAQLDGDTTRALRLYRRAQYRHSGFPEQTLNVMTVDPQVRRAQLLRARGREELADRLLEATIHHAGRITAPDRYGLAAAYQVAGDSASARRWLEAAYRAGFRKHRAHRNDPVWRSVGYAQAAFDRMAEDLAAQKKKAKAWAEVEGIEWPPLPGDHPAVEGQPVAKSRPAVGDSARARPTPFGQNN